MTADPTEAVANAVTAVAKLLETALKGLGTLGNDFFEFDRRKIERIGGANARTTRLEIITEAQAKAEAEIIKFETENELIQRTEQRLLTKEVKRQTNIEKTLLLAKDDLEQSSEPVSNEPVSEDWATRFFNIAQDVNDEDMQILWARVLAGEVKKPKSFSLRTLETLKNLSSEEAEMFQTAVSLSFENSFIIRLGNINSLKDYGLSYDKILILRDSRLISTGDTDYKSADSQNGKGIMTDLIGKTDKFSMKIPSDKKFKVDVLNFTNAGKEVAKMIQVDTNKKYFEDIKEHMTKKGYEIIT